MGAVKLQQQFVVRSLKYTAYAFGYLAQGDTEHAKECQDYMDMAKKDATKKDAKKDTACADVMKKAAPPKDEPKK